MTPILSDSKMFFGLAGSLVRTIDPVTEADPMAVLSQLLCAFGNACGRSPHFVAEADRHGSNLFVLNVGVSSKGRKGSSWGHVERLIAATDPDWTKNNIKSGLSSGEGLIHAVRDPENESNVMIDVPPADKRLLVVESEFSSVLKVISREGNTLSPLLRNAWDGRNLNVLTRNNPLTVTDPHISVIGHITKYELLKLLDATEISNGLGNRFLTFFVKRSKMLPEGGRLDPADMALMAGELKGSLDFARNQNELRRNEKARELWIEVYPKLSQAKPGLAGSLDGRAEAQVMRLALVQSLFNRKKEIGEEELASALSIHDYTTKSLTEIFGNRTGFRVADRVLEVLAKSNGGLSKTEISRGLSGHAPAWELDRDLQMLSEQGIIAVEKSQTEGRPKEVWSLATSTEKREKRGISPSDASLLSLNSRNLALQV